MTKTAEKVLNLTKKATELGERYSKVIDRIVKMELWKRLDKISETTNLKIHELAWELSDVNLFNNYATMMYEDYCYFRDENDVVDKHMGRTSSFFLDTNSNTVEYYRDAKRDELEYLELVAYDNIGYSNGNLHIEIENILTDNMGETLNSDDIIDIFTDVEEELVFLEEFANKGDIYSEIIEDINAVEKVHKYIESQKESSVDDFKEYYYENYILEDVYNIASDLELQEKDLKNPLITKEIMFIINKFEKELFKHRDMIIKYKSIDDLIKARKGIDKIEVKGINIVDFIALIDKIRLIQTTNQNIDIDIFNSLKKSSCNFSLEKHLLLIDFIAKISLSK